MADARTISRALNSFMPSAFDTEDVVYKALIADETNDAGAVTNALKDAFAFIDYYTKTNNVDAAETSLLESIIGIFSDIERHYSEPDDYLRVRYKARIERNGNTSWNSPQAIFDVFSYFFDLAQFYLVQNYPIENLIANGAFDKLDGWILQSSDVEFRIIYSKSFESGSALFINPVAANSVGYIEQKLSECSDGVYEFLFFFSSPKKGAGDVEYEIRDRYGKYWNVASQSWVTARTVYLEAVDDATSGFYKKIQTTVHLPTETDIYIRFRNRNGNGVLIDGVRFGKIAYPSIKVYLTASPEVFHDGSIRYSNSYNHNGFFKYYFSEDLESILSKIKPAGVYSELALLASRLDIPWDRITIPWISSLNANTFLKHDSSIRFNYGNVTFRTIGHDESILHDGEYLFDGLRMERSVPSNAVLYGLQNSRNVVDIHRAYHEQNMIVYFHDERIQHDSRFDHSGIHRGIEIGVDRMLVTKNLIVPHVGAAADSMQAHNEAILHDGAYIFYQSDVLQYYL